MTTSTTWRSDTPPASGWHITDRDPDMQRYFNGVDWSPPVHVESMQRHGPRVMLMLGEDQRVEWRD